MSRPTQWTVLIRGCVSCGHYTDGTAERTANGCDWCAAAKRIMELERAIDVRRRQQAARDDRIVELQSQLDCANQCVDDSNKEIILLSCEIGALSGRIAHLESQADLYVKVLAERTKKIGSLVDQVDALEDQAEANRVGMANLTDALRAKRGELGEDIITGAVQRLQVVLQQWREQEGIRPPPPAAVTEAPPSE